MENTQRTSPISGDIANMRDTSPISADIIKADYIAIPDDIFLKKITAIADDKTAAAFTSPISDDDLKSGTSAIYDDNTTPESIESTSPISDDNEQKTYTSPISGNDTNTDPIQALIKECVRRALADAETRFNAKLDEVIAHTAKTAARAALGALDREERRIEKESYDRKYHNVKLLLRNYRKLSEYFENAVLDIDDTDKEIDYETALKLMKNNKNDDLFVESLQKNYQTTKVIMAHVENMIDVYAAMCERSKRPEAARAYRCIYYLYLSPEADAMTAEQVAAEEHIDRRTVYKDVDAACVDLTTLFFGITGMEKKV